MTKHGLYKSPTYVSWCEMKQRCSNQKHDKFKYYGARGITVCDRWSMFELFLADMGERPPGTTLDRKDVNKGYGPDNCKWSTRSEQQRNTRIARFIEFDGVTKHISDWASELGVTPSTLRNRLDRYGWSLSRALTTGPMKNGSQ